MNTIENIKESFNQIQSGRSSGKLALIEQHAFHEFSKMGIPTGRHEEWKYTRIGSIFNKEYQFLPAGKSPSLSKNDLNAFRLPGHEKANELVFINGSYAASLSNIRSAGLLIMPLEKAAENEYRDIVSTHLGYSSRYVKYGIH